MSGEVRITMPLSYRPGERDDWGVIRDAEGQFLGKVSLPIEDSTLEDHRRTGTDPFQEIGRIVVDSVNSQVALGLPTLLPYPSDRPVRSEEHTSELQSLMSIYYAVSCLKKNNNS